MALSKLELYQAMDQQPDKAQQLEHIALMHTALMKDLAVNHRTLSAYAKQTIEHEIQSLIAEREHLMFWLEFEFKQYDINDFIPTQYEEEF